LRDNWFKQLAKWDAAQLVFLDESGINSKLGQRDYGYAPKGHRARSKVVTRHAPNLSLLPALTVDGYIICNVYEGAVNQNVFAEFIEHDLLPLCNLYPGPRSVIVLDNARVHKAAVFPQFINDHH
jgi:hypothetical protein